MNHTDFRLAEAVNHTKANLIIFHHDLNVIAKEIYSSLEIEDNENSITGISCDTLVNILEDFLDFYTDLFEKRDNPETTFEKFIEQHFDKEPCTRALFIDLYKYNQEKK